RSSSTFSPLCPKGGWPRSWDRHAASTMSGSQPSSAPMSRPTWATSREWVRRVRTKSFAPAPSTCVLAPSLRSAEECSTRARSRWKGVRAWDFGGSGTQRSRSWAVYPGGGCTSLTEVGCVEVRDIGSASRGVELGLVEAGGVLGAELTGGHPALRHVRLLGRSGEAPRPLHRRTGVGAVAVEVGERLHRRQAVAHLAADGVALVVPGHVLAQVAHRATLVLVELDQQLGVAAHDPRDLAEGGAHAVGLPREAGGEVGEQPG